MRRALAAALVVAASVFALPASAAPVSSQYVYEVVRLNAKAWPNAYVRVRPGRSAPYMYALVAPDAAGDSREARKSARVLSRRTATDRAGDSDDFQAIPSGRRGRPGGQLPCGLLDQHSHHQQVPDL